MNYDFKNIKIFVETVLKINTAKGKSTFEQIRERLTHKEISEKVNFQPDGIYYVDEKGREFKGFLFIEVFDPQEWRNRGWNEVPRFHILNCNTIERQRQKWNFDGHYVFSNQPVTDVLDADGNENDLLLCGNCYNAYTEPISSRLTTTGYCKEYIDNKEFPSNFVEKDLPKSFSINNFSYTPDWDLESKQYRMKMQYTCERCGIKLNQSYSDGYFLETHHKNGDKQDNAESNLMCLCILCHSNVDNRHRYNYNQPPNNSKLNDFVEIFRTELIAVGNPYINNQS